MTPQPSINLISFGHFEKPFLEMIAKAINNEFRCPVSFRDARVDVSLYYDASRRQYNANLLLHKVEKMSDDETAKFIGLFRVDLFIPILTYVFGQAVLGGRSAVASLYRLNNEYYGMKKDDKLLAERFIKEVNHELGHTFGLIHCSSPVCVMRSSTYVEDIDLKDAHLCPKCRDLLSQFRIEGNNH